MRKNKGLGDCATRTDRAGFALNLAARVFAVPALLTIAGCAPSAGDPVSPHDDGLRTWVDTKTGCRYLIYSRSRRSVSVTPLLRADGLPDCAA